MARVKHQRKRGALRMYELKRTQVVIWLSEDETRWLDQVRLFMPRATWARDVLLSKIAELKAQSNDVGREGEKVVHSTTGRQRNRRK